jgi:polyphosphate kinase
MIEIQQKDNVKARIIDKEQNNNYVPFDTDEQIRSQYAIYEYYKNKLKH